MEEKRCDILRKYNILREYYPNYCTLEVIDDMNADQIETLYLEAVKLAEIERNRWYAKLNDDLVQLSNLYEATAEERKNESFSILKNLLQSYK
jgi:hypothetical protein